MVRAGLALRCRMLLAACLGAALLPGSALAVPPPLGGLTQLSGLDGCVSDDGAGGECEDGREMHAVRDVAVSPDGKSAYATGSAVWVFSRDPATGALSQLAGTDGCVSQDGSGGECQDGRAVALAHSVAVSPDGKNVYVSNNDSVAVFSRDPDTGALSQSAGPDGCVGSAGGCTPASQAQGFDLVVSPDGKNVYVAGLDALAVLSRDTSTGALAPLPGSAACVQEGPPGTCSGGKALQWVQGVAVSPDGANVYVATGDSNGLAAFSRNPTTGGLNQLSGVDGCITEDGTGGECTDGKGLVDATGVVVSGDGENVYASAGDSDALTAFSRDPGTGALTQLAGTDGCVSETGSGGQCADGRATDRAFGLAITQDDRSVYVASAGGGDGAAAVFSRDPASGVLTQLPGSDGCVWNMPTTAFCRPGKAISFNEAVAVSSDGLNVYVGSVGSLSVAAFSREVPPVCTNVGQVFGHNTAATVALPCSDPNGDPITRSIVSGPSNGTLGAIDQGAGNVLFTPNAGFSGLDGFSFQASDGAETSNAATAGLTVSAAQQQGPDYVLPGGGLQVTLVSRSLIMRRNGIVVLRLRCRSADRCRGAATLSSARRVRRQRRRLRLGSARFSIPAGRTASARARVPRRARRVVRRFRRLRVRVAIRARDLAGNTARTTPTRVLRAARRRR